MKKKEKPTSEEPPSEEKPKKKKKKAAAAEGGVKKTIKKTFNKEKKRHEHTAVAATGVASATRVAKMVLWDLTTPLPKWAEAVPVDRKLCIGPAAAVALEMDGMSACNKLRHRLAELAQAHKPNMVIRPLTFERWRFGATWEEQSAGGKAGKKATAFPLLPSKADGSGGPAAQALMDDLQWQGLNEGAAREVAAALRAEAAAATAKLTTRRQQAVSGKPAALPPLSVTVNRHSLDFACGKRLAKLSLAGYAKLCALHRRHGAKDRGRAARTRALALTLALTRALALTLVLTRALALALTLSLSLSLSLTLTRSSPSSSSSLSFTCSRSPSPCVASASPRP